MKILSSFTHPHVVPNLYDTNSVEHKRRYFEGCWQPKGVCSILTMKRKSMGTEIVWLPTFF